MKETNKESQVGVRLNGKERELLEKMAGKVMMTKSNFIRLLIIQAAVNSGEIPYYIRDSNV